MGRPMSGEGGRGTNKNAKNNIQELVGRPPHRLEPFVRKAESMSSFSG